MMMPVLKSRWQPTETTRQHAAQMQQLLEELQKHYEACLFQGKEKHIQKARKQGKLLARERIEYVLDEGSPFLELLPLAGLGAKSSSPGGTTVGGIGLVCGRWTMITSNVGTEKGGAIDLPTLQKSLRLNEIARENALPVINFVESAGANLPEQAKIFNYGGAIFREITQRSKMGIPTISVVMGNATAGGAYVPGMSDYTIFVRNQAKVFLAGPPLVKMATNEIVDEESLGGAEMHATQSGVADYLAENELDAIRKARELVAQLRPPRPHFVPRHSPKPPRYPAEEIIQLVPPDPKYPFDMRELIARIVDDSRFLEFKPLWGRTLVTGWAEIHGYPVGIIANNGVLFSDSANKGAHFIELCNREEKPILFLQNITGFMVGKQYEQEGIIKHGAKLINAVSNSEVPHITLMVGASYGAGNYAMAGRAYRPRFLLSYPNSRIAVMGPEQLAGVMEIIQRQAAAKAGMPFDEQQAAMLRQHLMQEIEKTSSAWYSTAQAWDDGVIDPRLTRDYLGICLSVVNNASIRPSNTYGVFRM
ncbi:acyl-CoA carboxylase subunit beta [Thermonema rossianum]|uniref:acyl-CoA carboxylase subunit beta n=1 Tax=Thermonema rossianum TaxID=55505 RepID=UPI0008FFCCBA|nr:carboxyl transferase domain-containing protein [Thermonema rossianum]